jgi:hypothetical protein
VFSPAGAALSAAGALVCHAPPLPTIVATAIFLRNLRRP